MLNRLLSSISSQVSGVGGRVLGVFQLLRLTAACFRPYCSHHFEVYKKQQYLWPAEQIYGRFLKELLLHSFLQAISRIQSVYP